MNSQASTAALVRPRKIRIGDLLVAERIITEQQLHSALAAQKESGRKLGRELIEREYINEDQLISLLAKQLGIDIIDLADYALDPEVVQLIPEVHARRFRVIALEKNDRNVVIGMTDPTDLVAYDEISRMVGKPIVITIVKEHDLLASIDVTYRQTATIRDLAEELEAAHDDESLRLLDGVSSPQQDAPVLRLVRSLLEDAVRMNASDIHIEPDDDQVRIRFRIDGILQLQATAEHRVNSALVSRLKLMAKLDISEKRLPQDGRFNMTVTGKSVDIRLSTVPTQYGESAVLRILNQSTGVLDLVRLGIPGDILQALERMIHFPHGMVLVTGPTGSGKTTTLYGALKQLNDPGVKIITVEDPIEYRLRGINQIQVKPKIDLTFARVLRSILRQDPDIVLIGEMRDVETAEIGLRAAMTGHLVLSTLHTNDTIATPLRLVDMGAQPFLVASAVRGIVAQRLVRTICPECKEAVILDDSTRMAVKAEFGESCGEFEYFRGRGCKQCNNTGYHGRAGVYELLLMNKDLVEPLYNGDQVEFARRARTSADFHSLKTSAVDLVRRGITTAEEMLRIAFGLEQ